MFMKKNNVFKKQKKYQHKKGETKENRIQFTWKLTDVLLDNLRDKKVIKIKMEKLFKSE